MHSKAERVAPARWVHIFTAAAVVFAMGAVAGCGGSTSTRTTGAAATASGSPTPTQAGSAGLPAKLKQSGTVVIAINAPYPPFEDVSSGKLVGVDVELGQAVAHQLGLRAKFVNVPFSGIVPGLAGGRFDMAISAIDDTPAKEKTVDFVDYYKQQDSLLVKQGNPSGVTFGTMCGHKIAVQSGTDEAAVVLPGASANCKKAGKPPLIIQAYPDEAGSLLAVTSGRADATAGLSATSSYIAAQKSAFAVAPIVSSGPSYFPYHILTGAALPKGGLSPATVQKAFEAIYTNGMYGRILNKWHIPDGALKTFAINGGAHTS